MQSSRPQRFSKASTAIFWIVSIVVLVWIGVEVTKRTDTRQFGFEPAAPEASTTVPSLSTASSTLIQTPKGALTAEIADTDDLREQGLSGRGALPKDSAMLFVFPSAGAYGFWMKDMTFPLDMVWIGADKRVSGVASGISPDTYPEIFYPPSPVLYVLELDSGEAARHLIATGTKLVF
jgi:uncharacterized membrane protein (UPF0127 family)